MGSIDNMRLVASILTPTKKRVCSGWPVDQTEDGWFRASCWVIRKEIAPKFLRNLDLPSRGTLDLLIESESPELVVTNEIRILGAVPTVVLTSASEDIRVYLNAYFLGMFAPSAPEARHVTESSVGFFNDNGDCVGVIAVVVGPKENTNG